MITAFQMFNNKFYFIVRFVNEIEFDEYNYHRWILKVIPC